MEAWKRRLGEEALRKGIIDDPDWLERLDEPMPAWAVLSLILRWMNKLEKLEADYDSYD
ncbi:hypothetical protein LJK88_30015 [Paenibacillus sp. P26]|nr:hypothetical protein LJK88_30015 [Paenibacillus sp. P26]UUZ94489.1 hypothetical protein LJK87_08055 [Paenibacillus sp. P25]